MPAILRRNSISASRRPPGTGTSSTSGGCSCSCASTGGAPDPPRRRRADGLVSGAHSPSAYAAGLACRCPRCGRGRLFDGYLTVRPVCDACGLDLASHDTGDGPSVFVIFILGAVVVPLALTVEAAFQPPLWRT